MRSVLHSLMAVNDLIDSDPLNEDFLSIMRYFGSIGWRQAIVLDVHPNYLHRVNFDVKAIPHLLAKFGQDDNLRAVSSIVKMYAFAFGR